MKAAQLVAPRQWRIIEVEKPAAPAVGQMRVRLERVAICGSDKPAYWGHHERYPVEPGVTGHEGVGLVEDCPSGKYQVGERVILWGFDRGLFQEQVLTNDYGCIRVPKEPRPEVMLMSQLLGTVIHSFYKLGNIIDQRVVVLGQGPVGLLFNSVLRNLGARQIIGVDPLDYRLALARTMGATHVINPQQRDLVKEVTALTDGALADLVVEAVGEEETFNVCPHIARRNASVICFGIPDKDHGAGIVSLRMMDMYRKELRLITTVGPNPEQDYTVARDWIVQGRLDVEPILTHVLPFEHIQQGFEMAFERPHEQQNIKIVLNFEA